jgi:putative endonuclease
MSFYVYILSSVKYDKYYVGQSSNPERRLTYHNTIEKGFTSRYRPWNLVWTKMLNTREQARLIESKIKKWKSKIMIQRLVEGKCDI